MTNDETKMMREGVMRECFMKPQCRYCAADLRRVKRPEGRARAFAKASSLHLISADKTAGKPGRPYAGLVVTLLRPGTAVLRGQAMASFSYEHLLAGGNSFRYHMLRLVLADTAAVRGFVRWIRVYPCESVVALLTFTLTWTKNEA
jgi:hypothetical protein